LLESGPGDTTGNIDRQKCPQQAGFEISHRLKPIQHIGYLHLVRSRKLPQYVE
jgi:hypothetical protein